MNTPDSAQPAGGDSDGVTPASAAPALPEPVVGGGPGEDPLAGDQSAEEDEHYVPL